MDCFVSFVPLWLRWPLLRPCVRSSPHLSALQLLSAYAHANLANTWPGLNDKSVRRPRFLLAGSLSLSGPSLLSLAPRAERCTIWAVHGPARLAGNNTSPFCEAIWRIIVRRGGCSSVVSWP